MSSNALNAIVDCSRHLYYTGQYRYLLMVDLAITSSASCERCRDGTIDRIKEQKMPFNIREYDGSSHIVMSEPDNIEIIGVSGTTSTVPRTSLNRMSTTTTTRAVPTLTLAITTVAGTLQSRCMNCMNR